MSAAPASYMNLLKSGNKYKQNQNSFSGFKLMSRDRLSHIHNEMHVLMFPQVVTFDCKQYLQQLVISESLMRVYHQGGSCKWQDLDSRCQSCLKIMVCLKEKNVFLANVMFLIFIFTSFYIVQGPLL